VDAVPMEAIIPLLSELHKDIWICDHRVSYFIQLLVEIMAEFFPFQFRDLQLFHLSDPLTPCSIGQVWIYIGQPLLFVRPFHLLLAVQAPNSFFHTSNHSFFYKFTHLKSNLESEQAREAEFGKGSTETIEQLI
jgi:hypothetical protein